MTATSPAPRDGRGQLSAVAGLVVRLASQGRPVVATPQLVAVTTGILFGTAGLLVLAVVSVFDAQFDNVPVLQGLAGSAVVVGVASIALRHRLRPWVAHPIVLCGTGLITTGVVVAGDLAASIVIAGLYILIAADSAFFFSWPAAVAHSVIAFTACLVATGAQGPAGHAAALLITGCAALVGAAVAWLVRAAGAAETDPLTGLPNRRALDAVLDTAIADAQRSGRPLCAAIIDVDRFKAVNDAGGHSAGDELLVATAAAWRAVLTDDEVLGRLGGDEFVVILRDAALPAATEVVQQLREAMPGPHTCSIGVAQWDPRAPSLLLASADQALYEAKRSGRDRVRAHGAVPAGVTEMRRALRAGELTVHYQPVVSLDGGAPLSAEALVRWQHPRRGLVAPAAFLPMMGDDAALMAELGRFVLDTAVAQAAQWQRDGGPRSVGVNVTGGELLDPGYADAVAGTLSRHGLPAGALVLEVTETSLDADASPAVETLHRLRSLGVRIAIDDFGTGYSGLGRLRRLPVDILKIDRSFVQEIEPGATGAPLVQAIIALAAALDLDVIAEGVETEHEEQVLRALGCPRAQGYRYGRPAPPEQLTPQLPARPAVASPG